MEEVINQQECLMNLRTKLPLENDTIQRLGTTGEAVLKLVKLQLEYVDSMTGHIRELEQQRDSIRCAALEIILRQYSALRDCNLLGRSDYDLDASLQSLGNTKRTETDKLVRNREEFHHLQRNIKGLAIKRTKK